MATLLATPSKNWNINPRIDYAINSNNTLVLRYQRSSGASENGVGGITCADLQEIFNVNKTNTVQATETMVIGTKSVNEILFQFNDQRPEPECSLCAGTDYQRRQCFSPRAVTSRRISIAIACMSFRK